MQNIYRWFTIVLIFCAVGRGCLSVAQGDSINADGVALESVSAHLASGTVQTNSDEATLRAVGTPQTSLSSQNMDEAILTLGGETVLGSIADPVDPTFPQLIGGLTVSPELATLATLIEISFQVSEPLSGLPVVVVNGHVATLSEQDGESYLFTYMIQPDDPTGAAVISVTMTDEDGNETTTRKSLSLVVDQSPPYSQVLSPSGIVGETELLVSWVAIDNGAAGLARVELFWTKDGGSQRSLGIFSPSTTHTLFNIEPHGPEGTYSFAAVAIDNLGNAEAFDGWETTVEYKILSDITVDVEPDTASWLLYQSNGTTHTGTGDIVIPGLEGKFVGITWRPLQNYDTPESQVKLLVPNGEVKFTGIYKRHTGHIEIPVSPSEAAWSLFDGDFNLHQGEGNISLDLPTGEIFLRWHQLEGYFPPVENPLVFTLTKDTTVTLSAAEYRLNIDEWPPVITKGPLAVNISDTDAIIIFTTNKDAISTVFCSDGTTTLTVVESEYTTQHVLRLTGLSPVTAYTYWVLCDDLQGNGPTMSERITLQTLSMPDTTAPIFREGPTVTNTSWNSAQLRWVTDEQAVARVEYGFTTVSLGTPTGFSLDQPLLQSESTVLLDNLTSNSLYYYRVLVSDGLGNGPAISSTGSFETELLSDTTAPVLTVPVVVLKLTDTRAFIIWGTDEPSDTRIDYGIGSDLTKQYYDPEMVKSHRVMLVNLDRSTDYSFVCSSTDKAGNTFSTYDVFQIAVQSPLRALKDNSTQVAFSTMNLPDVTPPIILAAPQVFELTDKSALIRWETDEVSDSQVFYEEGITLSPIRLTGDISDHTEHFIMLTNLTPGTTYTFQAASIDISDNGPALSALGQFVTKDAPDLSPPALVSDPAATGVGETQVQITWTTDKFATTQVFYGDSLGTLNQIADTEGLDTDHTVLLTNLTPGKPYYYQVVSTNANGSVVSAIAIIQTEMLSGSVIVQVDPEIATWSIRDSANNTHIGLGNQTLNNIPAGPVTLTWFDLDNQAQFYETPTSTTVVENLSAGTTLTILGTYIRLTGSVDITVDPQNAPWTLIDAEGAVHQGIGSESLPNIPTGPTTIQWANLSGYETPDNNIQTLALSKGTTITFTTTYAASLQPDIGTPSQVRATNGSLDDSVSMTWLGAVNASHYRVYRAECDTHTPVAISPWQTERSFTDATARTATTYYYWVQAAADNTGTQTGAMSDPETGWRNTADLTLYKVTAKNSEVNIDAEMTTLTITPIGQKKATLKIVALKKMPKNVILNEGQTFDTKGNLYLQAGVLPVLIINGDLAKLYTQQPIHTLNMNGELKSLTSKNAHIERVTVQTLGSIKMSATPNALSSSLTAPLAARAFITTTNASGRIIKISLSGILLHDLKVTGQAVKSLKLASKKNRDKATKETFVSLGGQECGYIETSNVLGSVSVKGGGLSAESITVLGTSKSINIATRSALFSIGAKGATKQSIAIAADISGDGILVFSPKLSIQAKGGNITPALLVVCGELSKLSATHQIIRNPALGQPKYLGGQIGTMPMTEQSMMLVVSGYQNDLVTPDPNHSDMRSIYGSLGIYGEFLAGAAAINGKVVPRYTANIRSIKTAKKTPKGLTLGENAMQIIGQAHVQETTKLIQALEKQGNAAQFELHETP